MIIGSSQLFADCGLFNFSININRRSLLDLLLLEHHTDLSKLTLVVCVK